jgi:hypothetical protein
MRSLSMRIRTTLVLASIVAFGPACFLTDECEGEDECGDSVRMEVFNAPALQVHQYVLSLGLEADTVTCTMDPNFDSLTMSYEFGCDDDDVSASADGPNLIGRFLVVLGSAPTTVIVDLDVDDELVFHGEGQPTYETVEACNGQCSQGALRIDTP